MGLTPDKAIEILELNLKEAGPKMPPDVKSALMYGIDGLKAFLHMRNHGYLYAQKRLPCELAGV